MAKITDFDPVNGFRHDPVFSDLHQKEYWVTSQPLVFNYKYHGKLFKVVVPAGFHFSGDLVANEHWELISPVGTYPQISILHEYLVKERQVMVDNQVFSASEPLTTGMMFAASAALGLGKGRNSVIGVLLDRGRRYLENKVKINNEAKLYGNNALSQIRAALVGHKELNAI